MQASLNSLNLINDQLSISEASNAQYYSISPKIESRGLPNPITNVIDASTLPAKGQYQTFMDID